MTKRRARRRGKGKLRTVLIPVAAFILIVLLAAGTYSAATNAGWSISSIGIPSWITGLTGQGQGGTLQTYTSVSWNGQAWVTSTYTIANNGGYQQSLIPTGVIATKMSLVATFTDNTNQTIFENSTLPGFAGFALIPSIHGKQVRSVSALAAVAVLQPQGQNLPAGAIADFKLNFTAYITQLNIAKWTFVEKLVPFMNNGTFAMAVPPAFTVLPGEVFRDNPSGSGSRQVAWNLHAEVVVSAPGMNSFSLLPVDDISAASWDYSGQLTGGCTDCGGSAPPMAGIDLYGNGAKAHPPSGGGGGGTTSKSTESKSTQSPAIGPQTATNTITVTYEQGFGTIVTTKVTLATGTVTSGCLSGQCVTSTQYGTITKTSQSAYTSNYLTVVTSKTDTIIPGSTTMTTPPIVSTQNTCTQTSCTSTTIIDTGKGPAQVKTTTTPVQTVTTVGTHTYASSPTNTNGGISGTAIKPGQNGVLLTELPYPVFGVIGWSRWQLGATVYLVNPVFVLITLILALGIAGIIAVYMHLRKEES
jgi:hypothetical protein